MRTSPSIRLDQTRSFTAFNTMNTQIRIKTTWSIEYFIKLCFSWQSNFYFYFLPIFNWTFYYYEMTSGDTAPIFYTSVLNGGEWSVSRSDLFIPGEIIPGTHGIGDQVGLRNGLDAVKRTKYCPCWELNSDLQSVAIRLIWSYSWISE